MADLKDKKTTIQAINDAIKNSLYNVTLELLKDLKISKAISCLLMTISFLQMVALLFDSNNYFFWDDEFLLTPVLSIFKYLRLLPIIILTKNAALFWTCYSITIFVILVVILLYIYANYCSNLDKYFVAWPISLLKYLIVIIYWILFLPFIEILFNPLRCINYLPPVGGDLICLSGIHIFVMAISCLFIIIFLIIMVIISLIFNEIIPSQDNLLSRSETIIELEILIVKLIMVGINMYWINIVGIWVLVVTSFLMGIILCFQYYRSMPYYNSFISVYWGSLIITYTWIPLNGIIALIFNLKGNLIVITLGIPVLVAIVKFFRDRKIYSLLISTPDKIKNESEILIQIYEITKLIKYSGISGSDKVTLTGIINIHALECQSNDCPCKKNIELYDVENDKYSERNLPYHKDKIFLNHFIKRLYEDSISKFLNSVSLNLFFSSFLTDPIKNIHSALVELDKAEKKKPSLIQQFHVFRIRKIIENKIKSEAKNIKSIYSKLHDVTNFENILLECQQAIEQVCNFQLEFWTQMQNAMPDLNILSELGKRLFETNELVESHWNKLNQINSNYSKALSLYGSFQNEMRNHQQLGFELLEKAKAKSGKKAIDEITKSSEILFADDTAILHVSGNVDTPGRISKINHGFTKIFQYSKSEAIGHYVSLLIPSLISEKHKDYMEYHFKTGHHTVLNKERNLFALHRNGFSFPVKLVVRQIPDIKEGIQYVGMIRQIESDSEYILTDERGIIDSISIGIGGILSINGSIFKENKINIRVIAPELIKIFSHADENKNYQGKFKDHGGQKLTFIIPQNFSSMIKMIDKANLPGEKNEKDLSTDNADGKQKTPIFQKLNKQFNSSANVDKKITLKYILNTEEYKNYESKKEVKCEIEEIELGKTPLSIPLKVKVFKIYSEIYKFNEESKELNSIEEENNESICNANDNKESKEELSNILIDEKDRLISYVENQKNDINKNSIINLEAADISDKNNNKNKNILPSENRTTERVNDTSLSGGRLETKQEEKIPNMGGKYTTNVLTGQVNKIITSEINKTKNISFNPEIHDELSEQKQSSKISDPLLDFEEADTPRIKLVDVKLKDNLILSKESPEEKALNNNRGTQIVGTQEKININQEEFKKNSQSANPKMKSSHQSLEINKFQGKEVKKKEVLSQESEKANNLIFLENISNQFIQNIKEVSKEEKSPKFNSKEQKEQKGQKEQKEQKRVQSELPIQLGLKVGNNQNTSSNEEVSQSLSKDISSRPSNEKDRITEGVMEGNIEIKNEINLSSISDQDLRDNDITKRTDRVIERPFENKKTLQEKITSQLKSKKKQNFRIINNPLNSNSPLDASEFNEYEETQSEKNLKRHFRLLGRRSKKDTTKSKAIESKNKDDNDALNNEEKEDKIGDSHDNEEENQDAQSSITSGSTSSTIRSYYSLRTAIDEKYIPPAVRNMKYGANIVYILFLCITIIFFALQYSLFSGIKTNIQNVKLSESRLDSLIDIDLKILSLITIQKNQSNTSPVGYLPDNTSVDAYLSETQKKLLHSANRLKTLETELSLQTSSYSNESLQTINPQSLILKYQPISRMPDTYSYTLWQAIMEIIVCSFRITTMNIKDVTATDSNVFYVMNNSLNVIIPSLRKSTDQIVIESNNNIQTSMKIYLIILIIASVFVFLSNIFLFPIVSRVKKNKEKVLILFMSLKKHAVDNQLKRCHRFLAQFRSSNDTDMVNAEEPVDQNKEEDDDDSDLKEKDELGKRLAKNKDATTRNTRKFKRLSSNIGFIVIKFFIMLIIIEGYFLMIYFLSYSFFNSVTNLIVELSALIAQIPTNSYLLLIEKELILEGTEIIIENQNILSFIKDYYDRLYNSEEYLLNIYQSNSGLHTTTYNDNFYNIYYNNLCPYIDEFASNINLCQTYNQGILQKGLYSSVINYWDFLSQLKNDFLASTESERDKIFIKNPTLFVAEQMESYYFNKSIDYLATNLQLDIENSFSNQLNVFEYCFIGFIIYIFLVYIFLWIGFISDLQTELWKEKSILSILPAEIIIAIPSIKDFIVNNSSSVFFAKREDL